MSEWISIKDKLPEIGQDVWLRRCKKNGDPYRHSPIYGGYYGYFPGHPPEEACFRYRFGTWGNPEYCLGKGVTHWMLRVDDCPPPFWPLPCSSTIATSMDVPAEPPVKQLRLGRGYTWTPEGRAKRIAATKEMWRKRKKSQG